MEFEFGKCTICGGALSASDAGYGRSICYDCRQARRRCANCGRYELPDDMIKTDRGERYYCKKCARTCTTACTHCGALFSNGNFYYSDRHGMRVCNECAQYYGSCNDCGRIMLKTALLARGRRRLLCETCAKCYDLRYDPTQILDYHSDYAPALMFYWDKFKSRPIASKDKAYGVELEIFSDYYNEKDSLKSRVLINKVNPSVYFMHDGSLHDRVTGGDGYEIISHPCTFEYISKRSYWDNICRTARQCGFTSHNNTHCGLHIHVSRSHFGAGSRTQDENIGKVIILVYKHWDEIVHFSRRDIAALNSYARKPVADDTIYDKTSPARELREKCREVRNYTRYQAINLENAETVEFRFFRGTLRIETIQASLQLIHNLIQLATTLDVEGIMALKWAEVIALNDYPELKQYQNNTMGGE